MWNSLKEKIQIRRRERRADQDHMTEGETDLMKRGEKMARGTDD